jgi:two-component system, LytTR family, response regulator
MKKLNAVIVEDLPSNHKLLHSLLNTHCKEVNVVGVAETVRQAVLLIRQLDPRLVFLDIELPDGTGFDILNQFIPVPFKVIFVTGHQEYAYQAIKFHAVDFILKPISINELVEAVGIVTRIGIDGTYQTKIENVIRQLTNPDKITLMDSNGFVVIEVHEIIKLEANGNYTDLYLTGQRKLTYCRILKEFVDLLLTNPVFFRTHRSFLVNLNHVKSFNNQGVIKLTEDNTAHLGDSCREKFMTYFKHH